MNKRALTLILVTLAGETVFMLPFLVPRLYRPLMMEAWHLTNTDIGNAFFAYGITAMLSYIFGGQFADRFPARVLITLSLAATAVGSLLLVISPSAANLILTYEFFGVSTILLMWGALIKTTHIVGGEERRSTAMGFLDGGRGLTAAIVSTLLVVAVSHFFPDLGNSVQQSEAMSRIYIFTAGFTFLIAVGVWIALSGFKPGEANQNHWEFNKAIESLKDGKVWLLSLVILSSYCGYKGIDNYASYLVVVQHRSLSEASLLTSVIFWLRPLAAVVAGLLADRLHKKNGTGRFLILMLLLLLGGATQVLLALPSGGGDLNSAFAVVLTSATFAYALRAIYFSVFGDLKIQESLLGTTVGIVSFVGFLPDAFFGLVTGRMIDANPGQLGFQNAFLFTAACLFAGAAACYGLYRHASNPKPTDA